MEHLFTIVNRRPCEPEHKAAFLLIGANAKNSEIAAWEDLFLPGIYVRLAALIFREIRIESNTYLQDTC